LQSGGVTKDQYFLMCELMGTDPNPDEIPLEYNDLDYECQLALKVFNLLPDNIEGMGGTWLGKNFSGLGTFIDIYEIDDKQQFMELLTVLITATAEHHRRQQKQQNSKKSKGRR
jgi:hypothetical protein